MKTTRQQREALKAVYDRSNEWWGNNKPATYREFRRTAQFSFDCLMVPAANMWLGIETDGYTHS